MKVLFNYAGHFQQLERKEGLLSQVPASVVEVQHPYSTQ
jgi:hypothetical protein